LIVKVNSSLLTHKLVSASKYPRKLNPEKRSLRSYTSRTQIYQNHSM